jgi:hypothetical protein
MSDPMFEMKSIPFSSRRNFVRSICAAIPVFTFEQLVGGLPLNSQFVNIAREAGLRSKTIFGGEAKNKYLLETTGCGCAFVDMTMMAGLTSFWSTERALRPLGRRARHQSAGSTKTIAMGHSRTSRRRPASPTRAGARASVPATTITMAGRTFTSPIGAIVCSGTTTATEPSPTWPKRPA